MLNDRSLGKSEVDNCLMGVNVVIGIANGSVVPLFVIGCPLTRDSLPVETRDHLSIVHFQLLRYTHEY